MPSRPEFLTIPQAVARFQISERTIRRLLASGQLKRYRRAGDLKIYVKTDELERLRRLRPQPPNSDG